MKNSVVVNIYGRSYPMMTDEPPEYTEKLAEMLNQRYKALKDAKKSLSVQDAAAIISLECLDELIKNKQTEQNIRTQISAYAEDASESRAEVEKLTKEIESLKERIRQLESEIKLRHQFAADEGGSAEQIINRSINKAISGQSTVHSPANYSANNLPKNTGNK